MNELTLIKSADFNGISMDCYAEREKENTGDFWATREQIGMLLEYEYPREVIGKIHERNKERLSKFSAVVKLTTPSGVQATTVYNFKGLLEICRYSQQPKANAVMDWLWDVADEIRKTGSYNLNTKNGLLNGVLEGAAFVYKIAGIEGNQLTLAVDKIYRHFAGVSALALAGIELVSPVQQQALTPTEIAEALGLHNGAKGARIVNKLLLSKNYQRKVAGVYEPTDKGRPYAVLLDTNKKRSDGTPVKQLKWYSGIINVLEQVLA